MFAIEGVISNFYCIFMPKTLFFGSFSPIFNLKLRILLIFCPHTAVVLVLLQYAFCDFCLLALFKGCTSFDPTMLLQVGCQHITMRYVVFPVFPFFVACFGRCLYARLPYQRCYLS